MFKRIPQSIACLLLAFTSFQAQAGDTGHTLEPCPEILTNEALGGHDLLDNALALLNHLPAPKKVVSFYKDQGHQVCGTGVPLKKDIYRNHRYVGEIKVINNYGGLVANIPYIYTSPSVQTDHVGKSKAWVALPNQKFDGVLAKIKKAFVAQSKKEDFEINRPSDLYSIAKKQSWWDEEVESTVSILPITRPGDDSEYFAFVWLKLLNPTAALFTQNSSANMQVYKYDRASKTLEISAVGSAFSDLYIASEDILQEVVNEGVPQKIEERIQKIEEFGSLKYLQPQD